MIFSGPYHLMHGMDRKHIRTTNVIESSFDGAETSKTLKIGGLMIFGSGRT